MMTWPDESYQITIDPKTQYCTKKPDACWYAADNKEFESGETERDVNVDAAYIDANKQAVAGQLTKAGVRLGAMLNNALAP